MTSFCCAAVTIALAAEPLAVPYRLTPTQHVLVRAKINGKGPFHLILDTGAPAVIARTKVAEAVGLKAKVPGWATLPKLEIEGGVVVDKVQARFEDIYQLEGMNGMKLAGVELDGVIGYNVLSRFKIEYDFTKDKLAWTPVAYKPPPLVPFGSGKGSGSAGLEAAGGMLKAVGALFGAKADLPAKPRGWLGAEFDENSAGATISAVSPDSPAAKAGLRVGDTVVHAGGDDVASTAALAKALARKSAGESVALRVQRGADTLEFTVTLGTGF